MHLNDRLDNWASWARSSDGRNRSRCMSLEGKYTAPDWDGEERTPRVEYDLSDAIKLEKAICALPEQFRGVIKAQYCLKHLLHNGRYFATCRKLKVNPKKFDETLKAAKFALKNKLGD